MNALIVIGVIEAGGLNNPILFAAKAGELVALVVFIIFFLVPLLGQILTKFKGQPPKPPVRPARPAQPASVQNEIEEFLRRANQKKSASGNPPQRQQPMRPKPAAKPARPEIVRAEVVRERPVGGEVERHVKKYLDKEEFERRSEKMGEEVAEADDKIERRLKSVFDHSLSKIAATPGETATPIGSKLADTAPEITVATPSVAAYDVAALFGDPLSIRQAIIISEILNRPLERWEREMTFDKEAWDLRKIQ